MLMKISFSYVNHNFSFDRRLQWQNLQHLKLQHIFHIRYSQFFYYLSMKDSSITQPPSCLSPNKLSNSDFELATKFPWSDPYNPLSFQALTLDSQYGFEYSSFQCSSENLVVHLPHLPR